MKKVTMEMYLKDPQNFELRSGSKKNAPLCPFGNHFQWIGYDKINKEYVRFTKSVFKKLIAEIL